jgi:hypothetical protein
MVRSVIFVEVLVAPNAVSNAILALNAQNVPSVQKAKVKASVAMVVVVTHVVDVAASELVNAAQSVALNAVQSAVTSHGPKCVQKVAMNLEQKAETKVVARVQMLAILATKRVLMLKATKLLQIM